jgi:hypothetical protein
VFIWTARIRRSTRAKSEVADASLPNGGRAEPTFGSMAFGRCQPSMGMKFDFLSVPLRAWPFSATWLGQRRKVYKPARCHPAHDHRRRAICPRNSSGGAASGGPQYAPDILAAWAASLDPDNVRRMTKIVASRSELILVADAGRALAGFGSIVPKNAELRAVYISP